MAFEATLRAQGVGRFLGATFLLVWLVFWLFGELFCLGAILTLFTGTVAPHLLERLNMHWQPEVTGPALLVALFLSAWALLWTVGGFGAIHVLLRHLFGRDHIRIDNGQIELRQGRGTAAARRTIPLAQIQRVVWRAPFGAVELELSAETVRVSDLGNTHEREQLAKSLRRYIPDNPRVASALPPEWETGRTDGGHVFLRKKLSIRAKQGWVSFAIAVFLIAATTASAQRGSPWVASSVLGLFAALWIFLASWLLQGHSRWVLLPSQLMYERIWLGQTWQKSFRTPSIVVELSQDSDGDEHHTARIRTPEREKVLLKGMNSAREIQGLARWLSEQGRFPLQGP